MEEDKSDVALLRRLDKPDVAERVQCWRQQAGSHIDQGDGGISRIDGVEDPHLVGDVIDIDDIGHVRVETLQRPSWYFGVECANNTSDFGINTSFPKEEYQDQRITPLWPEPVPEPPAREDGLLALMGRMALVAA